MNTPRDSYFEENFEQALEAFANIELKAILDGASQLGYTSIAQALNRAARKAEDEGCQPRDKILRLLDKACWMRLSPSKRIEPLDDPVVVGGRRSPIPDDFTDSEICFFAKILDSIGNPFLKGRLADLVWHCRVPRKVKFALSAIDSYMQVPLNGDTWLNDGDLCWRRATDLSLRIGKGAGNRLHQIESSIIEAIKSATTQDRFFSFHLANVLISNGLAVSYSITVAEKLKSLADEFDAAEDFDASGRFYSASANWFEYSGDDNKSLGMTIAKAESFVNKADASVTSDNLSYRVAASLLEKAIQVHRDIPRARREQHNIDDRIQELMFLMNDYGKKALEEMATYSTPGVDVRDIVQQACDSVARQARGQSTSGVC